MAKSAVDVLMAITVAVFLSKADALRDKYTSSNVTETLDRLLANNRYDKRLRPGFGGPPITVTVNFFIKSIGPVSDNDESFGLDCYFRQHWYDMRLRYEKLPGLEELSMSWLFLDRVWKPDTYFVNGKKSFLHRITAPNKFLRLRHDGFITYSMRLTILASCPMYLKKFPLDAQKCPLQLGSYGYSNKDVVYKWTNDVAIGLQEGVEIAQFDLVNITKDDEKTMIRSGLPYSTIQADFWLKRHTGYFMLQVYIPCCLMVVCSWISFWIDPDAVPARVYVPCGLIVLSSWVSFWIDPDDVAARVALGVTTVLSLTTLGFGGRSQMPKVSYCTALDWFVIICFTYVFSVMIEYAVVNLNDKFNKDLKKMIENQKAEEAEKLKAAELEKNLEMSNSQKAVKIHRSTSCPTFPAKREKDEENPNGQKSTPSRLNPTYDLSNELIETVVAYLYQPELRLKSKSCPSLESIDRKGTGMDSDDSNWEDDPTDVFLNVDTSSVSDEIAETRTLKNCLDRVKTMFDFWNKSDRSYLMSTDSILDSTDKFSKLDVRSRKNFPAAFVVSLIIYTLAFTYYFTDENPDREPN